jgi:predicted DNA-binding transcriptional regulator AlpA
MAKGMFPQGIRFGRRTLWSLNAAEQWMADSQKEADKAYESRKLSK